MSQANLAEKIRVMTLVAGAITTNAASTAGSVGKCTKGILLIDVISKNNNDNTVTIQPQQTAPGGSLASLGAAINITSGAAARLAPILLTGIAPGGTVQVTTSAIAGTSPSILVRIYLIGFLSRVMPTTIDAFVAGFDTNGI